MTKSGEHAHAASRSVMSALTASISSMSILSTQYVEASAASRVLSSISGIQVRTPRPRNELFATPSTRLTGRRPRRNWAQDRLADVAVDDINYTTRSNVQVGQIREKAASKIGA